MITPRDEYFFDLNGYTVIPQALDYDHLVSINTWIDALPPLKTGEWFGQVYVQSYGDIDGINLQDVIEAGEIFERLIDHPAWIDQVRHYLGPSAKPYIYEIFINVRESGATSGCILADTMWIITNAADGEMAGGFARCSRYWFH